MAKKIQHRIRRSNNEGSIFQRKSDGKWVGSITVGHDEKGQQKKKTVYGNSQAEVAKKLMDISGRMKSYAYETLEKHTFGELMNEWLMVFKKSAVTPRTFEGIIRNFKLHIEPQIGNMKVYEVDTFVVQKVLNNLIDQDYSVNTIKKNKHLISQFFEYAIDNKWVLQNPTNRVQVRAKDKAQSKKEKYKALPPEVRIKFLEALNRDEANFIKPLCITLMFAGLRIGEVLALKWKNINFANKTIKIERAITQTLKFDEQGNVKDRTTIIGDTKTACSVRDIPVTDIVLETLKQWKEKQSKRQETNPNVTAILTAPTSFVFANDNRSYRTYYGTRVIFDRFKRRNGLNKYHIHFHGLRHTFSNMLFEMNENPKVIQQLLGHKDVKTTITVYNNVNSDYVKESTNRLNDRLNENEIIRKQKNQNKEEQEEKKSNLENLSDEDFDLMLEEMLKERKERKRKREKDFEM